MAESQFSKLMARTVAPAIKLLHGATVKLLPDTVLTGVVTEKGGMMLVDRTDGRYQRFELELLLDASVTIKRGDQFEIDGNIWSVDQLPRGGKSTSGLSAYTLCRFVLDDKAKPKRHLRG